MTPKYQSEEVSWARLESARDRTVAAEAELDQAVAGLRPVPLGDKRLADESVDRAFAKLRSAREELGRLRDLGTTRDPLGSANPE